MMRITVLGCGTSQGVPVIGCTCPVCSSSNPHDHRTRTSILIETEKTTILVDCGPDFRQQMLREHKSTINAVLITHQHKDHIGGLDDLRPIEFRQEMSMPIYASPQAQEEIKREYSYAFVDKNELYPGAPTFEMKNIVDFKPIIINEVEILPIPVTHFEMLCYAFRIGDFAYLTDFNIISDESLNALKGTKKLIIEALHHEKHYSHINLKQAIKLAQIIGAEETYFTHCSHHMGLANDINPQLPQGMQLAYDGQVITL